MADTPTESSDEADITVEDAEEATESAPAEHADAAPAAAEEAPVEEPKAPAEPPKAQDEVASLEALQERLAALESAIAGKDEEIKALRDTAAKDSLVRDAGLPSKYSQFLHGDESTWGDQVKDLLELTSKTPARPRDPAVDAQVGSDSEDRETAILRMFGLAE